VYQEDAAGEGERYKVVSGEACGFRCEGVTASIKETTKVSTWRI
jgi:hypothetical protein